MPVSRGVRFIPPRRPSERDRLRYDDAVAQAIAAELEDVLDHTEAMIDTERLMQALEQSPRKAAGR